MIEYRRITVVAAVALLVAASGCVGMLTDETLAFEASPGTVSDAALSDSGYERVNQTDHTIEENVSVAGHNRTVRLTNWVTTYQKNASLAYVEGEQSVAQAYIISTPGVTIAGHTVNPIADLSNAELVEFVIEQAKKQNPNASAPDIKHVSDANVTLFGEREKLSKFHATVERNGRDTGVYIHVTSVDHEGDYVTVLGMYPVGMNETEEDALRTFINGVRHDGEGNE